MNPRTATSLAEVLRWRALHQPHLPALTFLGEGRAPDVCVDYAAMDRWARRVAEAVWSAGGEPGDRVVLLFPPGLAYVAAFLGCLYAGAVAVPVYLPRGARQLPRLEAVLADARPRLALTTAEVLARDGGPLRALLEGAGVCLMPIEPSPPSPPAAMSPPSSTSPPAAMSPPSSIASERCPDPTRGLDPPWRGPTIRGEDLAFLQYTSGSTGDPRGAMVSHANLMHNSAAIHEAFGHGPESKALLWAPPYHDMGLIGGIVQPLYGGFPGLLMSPLSFLRHPLGWLRAVSRHRATTSGGPDFAYALCARKARPEDLEGLDLSCWRVAFDGAEPVRATTLEAFAAAFAPAGFRRRSFLPCYGLAEATLLVSGGSPSGAVLTLGAEALARHRVAPTGAGEDGGPPAAAPGTSAGEAAPLGEGRASVRLVSCGRRSGRGCGSWIPGPDAPRPPTPWARSGWPGPAWRPATGTARRSARRPSGPGWRGRTRTRRGTSAPGTWASSRAASSSSPAA